jgi:hypothetical protein
MPVLFWSRISGGVGAGDVLIQREYVLGFNAAGAVLTGTIWMRVPDGSRMRTVLVSAVRAAAEEGAVQVAASAVVEEAGEVLFELAY